VPTILHSVESSDPTIRGFALITVMSFNQRLILESLRTGETLPLLNPYIPAIAAHLTDPDQRVRKTSVLALGSFGTPISDAFPPMIAYLKRDDATTTIGSAIVFELAARGCQRSDVEDASSRTSTARIRPPQSWKNPFRPSQSRTLRVSGLSLPFFPSSTLPTQLSAPRQSKIFRALPYPSPAFSPPKPIFKL
jgi:hypothetical protein